MGTFVIDLTKEEYALLETAAKEMNVSVEEYASEAISAFVRTWVAKYAKTCVNCGGYVVMPKDVWKHLRTNAEHCDLDDPDSLSATITE